MTGSKTPLYVHAVITVLAVGAAFVIGRSTQPSELDAQGVTVNGPGPSLPPAPSSVAAGLGLAATSSIVNPGTGTSVPTAMIPYSEGNGGGAVSANGILAVTGSYGVGTSVLYVIDTETKQLAVYEARGGPRTMRRLNLVGARRIDLDLQLRGYNDESEYQYSTLEKMFAGRKTSPAGPDTVHTIDPSVKSR